MAGCSPAEPYRYDSNGDLLFDCYTFKDLLPGEFQIDRKLNQASLATQVECVDWVSGNPMTFVVDVTLNAIGPAERDTRHQHIKNPDFKGSLRVTGVYRDAEGRWNRVSRH